MLQYLLGCQTTKALIFTEKWLTKPFLVVSSNQRTTNVNHCLWTLLCSWNLLFSDAFVVFNINYQLLLLTTCILLLTKYRKGGASSNTCRNRVDKCFLGIIKPSKNMASESHHLDVSSKTQNNHSFHKFQLKRKAIKSILTFSCVSMTTCLYRHDISRLLGYESWSSRLGALQMVFTSFWQAFFNTGSSLKQSHSIFTS